MRILIADSGATKSEWALIENGRHKGSFICEGVNLSLAGHKELQSVLSKVESRFSGKADKIYFYCAGLATAASGVTEIIKASFKGARIHVESDLLGAARAVCGNTEGIACILGTGSNSCYYDGKQIRRHMHAGGFILGDEGSAARLGKMFLSAYIRKKLSPEVVSSFESGQDRSYRHIVTEIYKGAAPSRYLGSFAPFILGQYGTDEYVSAMIEGNFRDFFRDVLSTYPGREFGAVGGFAAACRDILARVAAQEGFDLRSVAASPVDGLIKFHSQV